MNLWNTTIKIELNEERRLSIKKWYELIASTSKPKRKETLTKNPISVEDDLYLRSLYLDQGIGIKTLAKAFEISYSRMRVLLKDYVGIEFRSCKETTPFLRNARSQRVKGENNPWYDWPSNKPMLHKISRGIQGYYEKKDGKRIWLRSSWEYIYASWLDKQNIVWKYEDYGIRLSNGERYRPDFLIYENGELTKIVEIKGYFDNRRYKAEILKQDLLGKVDVVIIDDISMYINDERNTETWRQMCKSRELESNV